MLAMFMTVYLLGGGTPDISVVRGEVTDVRTCQRHANRAMGDLAIDRDPATGRPVVSTFYECVPFDADGAIRQINAAKRGKS